MGAIMVCKHCKKRVDVGFLIRLPSDIRESKELKKYLYELLREGWLSGSDNYTEMPERCPKCKKAEWELKRIKLLDLYKLGVGGKRKIAEWEEMIKLRELNRIKFSDYVKKFLSESGEEKTVESLNHITHIDNLKSILDRGILSRNKMRNLKLDFKDISDKDVQRLRNRIEGLPRELHDYVPLYFAEDTPMLYKVRKENDEENIVIIKVNINLLLMDDVYFSDRNCASKFVKSVHIYKGIQNLEKLRWDKIMAKSTEYKMLKMAEVLVPNMISPSAIEKIIISADPAKQKVKLLRRALAEDNIGQLWSKIEFGRK
ncbi:MAG: DUF4433 domain-containing protein [Nanoarchaeota archaeon]|nr:DUF4433 domain-containing protein [Nanoarchaeota archaeon]MCG2717409.1 DUF4433 domain-containing protein [Nanoarchaeota archaeon]